MFGFRARSQDKRALPAGPNHCLLSAWLACLPQSRAWPPTRPAVPCPPSRVSTEGLQSLLLGRSPVADGCPVSEAVTGVPACPLGD